MPRSLAEEAEVIDMPQPFRAIDLEDFLAREFPPRENLLAPWLPAKGLAMIFAPRGVGKTHLALNVAYAVASGSKFLKWAADRPRKVVLLDGEMPAIVLQERLATIVANSDAEPPPGNLKIACFDLIEAGAPDIGTEDGQRALEPHIGEADLIVVDNLSTLARTGKENEAEGWGIIQSWALTQRRKGRSVLFVHHAGKGGEQRGTSKREDVLDTVIRLSHPDDYEPSDGARFLVAFTKSRGIFGHDVEPFEAKIGLDGKWACTDTTCLLEAEVSALLAEGKSLRDIANELGINKNKVDRIKKRLGK